MADVVSQESGRNSDDMIYDDDWDTYNLEWLFDPDRTDHLSIEDQLKLYQQRDLRKTKVYKYASRIWGAPKSRKRVIYAYSSSPQQPGQENLMRREKHDRDVLAQIGKDNEHIASGLKATEVVREYRTWINQRKQFRNQIELMRLSEEWLRRKPDKTGQEQRVLARMIEHKLIRPPTPVVVKDEPPPLPVLPVKSPVVARPSPVAIKIIERFLHENKLRLIDLFKSFDKNKTWLVSGSDFKKAIKKAGIPISDVMLDDLMVTLDMDLNDKLDYRELTKGLGLWKVEKRERKQQRIADVSNSPAKLSQLLGFEPPEDTENKPSTEPCDKKQTNQIKIRNKTTNLYVSTKTDYLEVPPPDLREERFVPQPKGTTAKERERRLPKGFVGKSKNMKSDPPDRITVSTTSGVDLVARNLNPSTLGGEAGPLVDRFRQLQYKEYQDVQKRCQENKNVHLSEHSLKKVLLYPEDKDPFLLKKHIRYPGMSLQQKSDQKG